MGNCDFETHDILLKSVWMFLEESDADKCPIVDVNYFIKLLEKLIRVRRFFFKDFCWSRRFEITKEPIKYILFQNMKISDWFNCTEKMVELGLGCERVWFLDQKEEGRRGYNFILRFILLGNVAVTYKLIQLGCKMVRRKDDWGEHVLYPRCQYQRCSVHQLSD